MERVDEDYLRFLLAEYAIKQAKKFRYKSYGWSRLIQELDELRQPNEPDLIRQNFEKWHLGKRNLRKWEYDLLLKFVLSNKFVEQVPIASSLNLRDHAISNGITLGKLFGYEIGKKAFEEHYFDVSSEPDEFDLIRNSTKLASVSSLDLISSISGIWKSRRNDAYFNFIPALTHKFAISHSYILGEYWSGYVFPYNELNAEPTEWLDERTDTIPLAGAVINHWNRTTRTHASVILSVNEANTADNHHLQITIYGTDRFATATEIHEAIFQPSLMNGRFLFPNMAYVSEYSNENDRAMKNNFDKLGWDVVSEFENFN